MKKAPAPRLRARLREATTDAIRAAAEEVFAEQGFRARMEDIAERAGVSVGMLYNHFEDRDALLLVLIQTRREALLAQVDQVLAEVEGRPFREQLRTVLDKVFGHFHEHARFFAIVMVRSLLMRAAETKRGDDLRRGADTLIQVFLRGIEV